MPSEENDRVRQRAWDWSKCGIGARQQPAVSNRTGLIVVGAACCALWGTAAAAQGPLGPADAGPVDSRVKTGDDQPTAISASTPADTADTPVTFADILGRDKLLGDMGGLRTLLGNYGVTLTLTDVSDVLGNTSGGIDKGATYSGLTTLTLQMDTQKAFGWEGGTVNVSGLQIRGRNLSQYYIANLQTVSDVAAEPTTRLWEIWYQQAFADDVFDIKIGQQSIDQEFMTSQAAFIHFNAAMGWASLPSSDLYAGGPAYPLSSLGVRVRARPTDAITLLAGVFQDNPPGGAFYGDTQLLGSTRWGGNFNLRTGALFFAEAQYAINQPPKDAPKDDTVVPEGLPGVYKIGAWFDTAAFPNQRYDTQGIPLASTASNGNPQMNLHNASLYALFDQTIWKPDPKGARAITIFARAMGAPDDRNLISFAASGGINLSDPLPDRDDDTFGIGFGIAQISSNARDFNRDQNYFGTTPYPVPIRSSETFIEVTYQIQATPWLQIQPVFQYVFNPSGGIANPNNPALRVKNAAIFGFSTAVTF